MENALPRPFLIGTMIVRHAYIFRISKISKSYPTLNISLQLIYSIRQVDTDGGEGGTIGDPNWDN